MKKYHVFAEVVEQKAMEQFLSAMALDCVVQGALMPDVHAGYSLPIGAVVKTWRMVFPSWVGYDIGCGMLAIKTYFNPEDIRKNSQKIFEEIYKNIPVGFARNTKNSDWYAEALYPTDRALEIFEEKEGLKQLGSLGSGNHFIEIGVDEEESVWIIIHSGSRGIGHAIATHYMQLASGDSKAREGHYGFDIRTSEGQDYLTDMNFCLKFALRNREEMMERVIGVIQRTSAMKKSPIVNWFINRNHNHAEIDGEFVVHRKGATQADIGVLGVIPGNMKDGSFIVKGKGNRDSLCSSSHGAGRVMSRSAAKKVLPMDTFSISMEGITARVSEDTLDESPLAYKSIYAVMRMQESLVSTIAHVKPLINIKA